MINYEEKYVLAYKTRGEIQAQRFVFDSYGFKSAYDGAGYDYHLFVNTDSMEELTLPLNNLEYMITKPYTPNPKHN